MHVVRVAVLIASLAACAGRAAAGTASQRERAITCLADTAAFTRLDVQVFDNIASSPDDWAVQLRREWGLRRLPAGSVRALRDPSACQRGGELAAHAWPELGHGITRVTLLRMDTLVAITEVPSDYPAGWGASTGPATLHTIATGDLRRVVARYPY